MKHSGASRWSGPNSTRRTKTAQSLSVLAPVRQDQFMLGSAPLAGPEVITGGYRSPDHRHPHFSNEDRGDLEVPSRFRRL